jgi:hypothetical protein
LDLFEEAKASEGAAIKEDISYLSSKDSVMNYKPSKILKFLACHRF